MKKIITGIAIIVLICSLFAINYLALNKKENKDPITTKTTTKKVDDTISDVTTDKVMIEGMEEEIKVSTYSSHLGFSIKYDVEKYSPTLLSNGTVEFTYVYNDKIKLRIERFNKINFYEESKELITEEVIDNNRYNYIFKTSNDSYYRIITIVPDYPEYADAYVILNYMVDSFSVL